MTNETEVLMIAMDRVIEFKLRLLSPIDVASLLRPNGSGWERVRAEMLRLHGVKP